MTALPAPCMALALDEDGGRLCCHRTAGHYPRSLHADYDDNGNLVEWGTGR